MLSCVIVIFALGRGGLCLVHSQRITCVVIPLVCMSGSSVCVSVSMSGDRGGRNGGRTHART